MSIENIRRILADEVFEVLELDGEMNYEQSFMTFREFETQSKGE